jgi:hypothetical protein
MQIGEITPAAPGDQNFSAEAGTVLDDRNAAAAPASFNRAHQAGGSAT